MIAIIDYGMGNRRSVEKAFAHVGADARITRDHDELGAADALVIPGVGAFPRGMENLGKLGLDVLIRERVAAGTPVLGICLGMQLAFESSSEHGGAAGLGILAGAVRRLVAGEEKLPHIGWNLVRLQRDSPLTHDLPAECAFYHVHSYAPIPSDPDDVIGTAEYGERFATVVARDSFYGVQFHPEKSSVHGLELLANFARIAAEGRHQPATQAAQGATR